MSLKLCTNCNKLKVLSEFHKKKDGSFGVRSICKICRKRKQRENREENSIKRKKHYQNNKDKYKNSHLKSKYGINLKEFNKMLEKQKGCAICGSKTAGGRGAFHVDHSHKTGEIRGLLCNNCNAMLGWSRENPFIMIRAITYLKGEIS